MMTCMIKKTAKELDNLIETIRCSIQKIGTTSFNQDEIVRGLVSILKNNMATAAMIIENLDSGSLGLNYRSGANAKWNCP